MRTEPGAVHNQLLCTKFSAENTAENWCDTLLAHTFECELCINAQEEMCATYCSLQKKIADAGGPRRGAILMM